MFEKIAVIGSNSFSGSNFIDYCLKQSCEVIGLSRSEEAHPVFLPYKNNINNTVFYQRDLNHHLNELIDTLNDFKPDYVVNFAAQGMVAQSWENPGHWFKTNTLSNVLFHDRLRKLDFLKKYVHVSTPEVYGSCEGYVSENHAMNPSTPYAVSRAAADMSLRSFYNAYKFPVSFTRSANVYGAGQQLYRIIPRTIMCILTGEKLQLHGGGTSVRSFIHIDDVSAGTLKVAQEPNAGEIYHFSTDHAVSIRELVELICNRLGADFNECVEVVGDRLGKDGFYLLDNAKAKSNLGWSAQVTLNEGIDKTIEWVKNNLETLKKLPQNYIHKE
ncbi:GDP-mannose 4,6-dehydratase [Lentisphaera marina]|uniref:GDP-mannose 4,6-dehydratase n=1 Tax=Lentisphaera marina TaxID=1111041 RepID=UPI002367266F|nr:GDP-mannose 4,6-dehydratase [Lentisphaera marina]MDD7985720.1 GDP-mannose 4,6-dehydratase [Lentisphaera marina]